MRILKILIFLSPPVMTTLSPVWLIVMFSTLVLFLQNSYKSVSTFDSNATFLGNA